MSANQMTVSKLLLLLTAVTPDAVALTHSTLTTDQLHTVLCVDRRKQTLLTRKTSRRLDATHNAGRRPQRSQ